MTTLTSGRPDGTGRATGSPGGWAPVVALSLLLATLASNTPALRWPLRGLIVLAAYLCVLHVIAGRHWKTGLGSRAMLAFTLVALGTSLINGGGGASALRAAVLAGSVILCIALANADDTSRVLRACFLWFPALSSAYAVSGLALGLHGSTTQQYGQQPRLTHVYLQTHPNSLSLIAAVGVLACIYFYAGTLGPKRWVLMQSALHLVVVTLTYSRSALGCLVMAIVVLAFVGVKFTRYLGALIAFGVIGSALFADRVAAVVLRSQQVSDLQQLSGRLPIWQVASDNWRDSAWSGIGYGTGAESLIKDSGLYLAYEVTTFDNVFLDAVIEVGFAGVLALLFVYLAVGRYATSARRLGMRSDNGALPLACAVAFMLLVQSLSSPGIGRYSVLSSLLVVALVTSERELQRLRPPQQQR